MSTYSSFDILQWLPTEAQAAFAQAAHIRKFSGGQVVYTQADRGDEMYRIASGSIRLSGFGSDGRQLIYLLFEEGDCFGISSVIDGEPRLQTAEALGDTQLQAVKRSTLNKLREDHPAFNDAIMRLLTGHLRMMADYFASSHLDEMSDRLLQRILDAASVAGVECEEGIRLSHRLSQSELAMMVGASRQSVNRALQNFQNEGLLTLRYGSLIIRDLERVRALRKKSWRLRKSAAPPNDSESS